MASLLNKMLTTMERVESGLAGFLCVDIFRILAAHKCEKMRLPTGSTFMASQTCSNLQSCALASVVLCLTKHREFDPWRSGDCRLSELSIEQYFGHLRIQSSNSQLSTRAYFHAAWKHALKVDKKLIKQQPHSGSDAPLSASEPLSDEHCWNMLNPIFGGP